MALGQADQLGNTLLQNRVMKQQQTERADDRAMRERMFNENVTARKEAAKTTNDWHTQNEDQQQLQTIIKANADGSLDDAGREKANQWIASHPKLSGTGIQLVKPMPKQPGQFNTAPGHNLEVLTQLRADVAKATTPADKANAAQKLNDFLALTGKSNTDDGMETVTEDYPAVDPTTRNEITTTPGQKRDWHGIDWLAKDTPSTSVTNKVEIPGQPARKVTYKQPRGGGKSSGSQSKPLDKATAQQLLQEAGGDKAKARELAAQRGYSF